MDIFVPGPMGPALLMLLVAADIWHGSASPIITPNLSTVIVDKGDPVSLLCSGNSSVEWVDIQNGSNVMVYTNGTLYVSKASCKDMRNYQCAYVNGIKQEVASVFLFVRDPRSAWCCLQKYITATEGSDAVLPCLITDPDFTSNVTLLNGSNIISSGFSFSAQEGIRLHKVNKNDVGWYKCRALVQGQWVESPEIVLLVEAIVSVTIEKEENVRIQGEPFEITCRISCASHSYEGNWTYPSTVNVSLTKVEGFDDTLNVYFTNYILSIPAVQLQDSGTYTCFGSNSAGTFNSSAVLRVTENGYVRLSTLQNRSQETNLHGSLKLQVLIDAYPRPYTWRWTHMNPSRRSENSTFIGQITSGNNRYNNTLKLTWMEERHSGIYTFFADNGADSASITFTISVKTPPAARLTANNSSSLWCEAAGYPAPHIEWYKLPRNHHADRCDQGGILLKNDTSPEIMGKIPFGRVSLKSILEIGDMLDNVTFCCLAVNNMGNESSFSSSVLSIKGEMENLSGISKPVIICAAIMVFLLLCILFLFYKYKQKPQYQVRWKIIEACEGNNYTFIDPTQLPYNEKWEFPRNNLQFGKTLGAGAFGKVVEATAFGLGNEDSVLKVAVKMLKSTAHTDEQEALMSELKIMSHLGHHENIVNLLGACTHGGPVFVITEYCPYGDLLNFLRKKAECFIIQDLTLESSLDSMAADYKNIYLGKKYVWSDSGFGSQGVDSYLEMRPVTASLSVPAKEKHSVSGEETDSHPVDLHDLLQFSNQVAQGMAFLASKNCIHRDLAARNVLVADGQVAKICDFGLARDIMNDINYVVKGNARLPVKWMAPESIFECVYTVQSDVWSYGILLWEIFSLGRSPYPGMKVNSKFYSLVKQGYHMGRPEFAPEDIYNIMTACWNVEPTQRPTFSQICTFLQKQLDASKEQGYTNLPSTTEEDSGCEPASYCEESCDSEEMVQPLLNSNNYQFC
ncbi:macrophage colony-stimulating factor 1 receptor [Rhineura floridana]|uniref:macrophage colony-stimulating factor 1 receptor n=1 Tax=Rhineura floridana TaxID=261503 RepID=UPI002AC85C8F|nr:macrophage colony-stimulating factor 1 receptor [Rhineura floridana]XP_061473343.1 macrophage colony-stimulating factor 1 receptor [Rhineura floridana]XP_061473344.1 macrophage colony-stimulating factor 1 receptor [Rhineura floridana]